MFIPSVATGIEHVLPLAIFFLIFLVLRWMQRSHTENKNASADDQRKHSEKSMREFLEALGLPENVLPPSEISTHSADRRQPSIPAPLLLPAVPASTTKIPAAGTVSAKAAGFQRATGISKPTKEVRKKAIPRSGLQRFQKELHNPHCLRRAIVLREILKQPKAYDRDAPSHW